MSDAGDAASTQTLEGAAPARHTSLQRVRLLVVSGPDAGLTHTSARDELVIGTHESADLVLHDETVSRFHCVISVTAEQLTVRDLGSRNGTTLDGVSIVAARPRAGSTLKLGRTELRFELQTEPLLLPISGRGRFGRMVGKSVAMRRAFSLLERAAASDATVLLEGETGTGKEIAAESIHMESARRNGPFIVVDCASIPQNLLESELFGHEKGSFTGASGAREGAFEAANGGTIFLDEIGELGLELQPRLLRALERKQVKRVGTNKYVSVDVRVVAATNRNLHREVNERRFRSDLYYRLAVVEVRLPPLRERPDDLPALIDSILVGLGADALPAANGLREAGFVAEVARHGWPGNVRELRNYLERCLALQEHVPMGPGPDDDSASGPAHSDLPDLTQPLKIARERWTRVLERRYVEAMLARHQGNVAAAAREAAVDRMHFYRLLWRYGLK
jgi:transcriptional regulator with PAS, ATPase and Fis domain